MSWGFPGMGDKAFPAGRRPLGKPPIGLPEK